MVFLSSYIVIKLPCANQHKHVVMYQLISKTLEISLSATFLKHLADT